MKETEVAIYAEIHDWKGLEQAQAKLHQTQHALFKNDVQLRVREEIEGDKSTYSLTIKSKLEGPDKVATKQETTIDIDQAFFNQFKALADETIRKDRYVFSGKAMNQATGEWLPITYEVDCFLKESYPRIPYACYDPICKIDIELDDLLGTQSGKLDLKFDLKQLPLDLKFLFTGNDPDPEVRNAIVDLFAERFTQKAK